MREFALLEGVAVFCNIRPISFLRRSYVFARGFEQERLKVNRNLTATGATASPESSGEIKVARVKALF
jgi:hypothetical protein